MFISILSLLLVFIITGMCICLIYVRDGELLNISQAHCLVMSLSTIISLTLGTILATLIDYHFFISLLFGLAFGLIIGKPFGSFAIVDGMVSGLMGGIMGVMVPMMVHINQVWSVLFMDIIFIILISINLKLFLLLTGKGKVKRTLQIPQKETKDKSFKGY
ncbi:hypothetical protein [Scopulibacillus cellulosilyticus]|uniref:Uncharacterized protein n=1 Tax=Scopulibacillus cellulosilyticus TaxID=2665665 RepID=A0ABW2PRE7_9BACL